MNRKDTLISSCLDYCYQAIAQTGCRLCCRAPKLGLLAQRVESQSLMSGWLKKVGIYGKGQSKELGLHEELGVLVPIGWNWGQEVRDQLMSKFLVGQWSSWSSSDWSVMLCSLGGLQLLWGFHVTGSYLLPQIWNFHFNGQCWPTRSQVLEKQMNVWVWWLKPCCVSCITASF